MKEFIGKKLFIGEKVTGGYQAMEICRNALKKI